MLLLTNDDVREVLDMPSVMEVLRRSYAELAEGLAVCRPNMSTNIPIGQEEAFFKWSTMEGGSAVSKYFAMRLKCDLFHRERRVSGATEVITQEWYSRSPGEYCGLIILVSAENAEILAILHDSVIQRMRVGADGGIGCDYMARGGAEVLGVLGSGGIARAQIEATMAVRPIRKVQIYSPTKRNRERLAGEIAERFGIEADSLPEGEAAFRDADILAGCTSGGFAGEERNAAIVGRWLEKGTHYTNVCVSGGPTDSEARRRTDVFLRFGDAPTPVGLDSWAVPDSLILYAVPPENPRFERDRFYRADNSSRIAPTIERSRTVYLADLLRGDESGRASEEQITFSERGSLQGAQFHAVASLAYERAIELGVGRELPTEWFLQRERN